jgi:hypothetical protein
VTINAVHPDVVPLNFSLRPDRCLYGLHFHLGVLEAILVVSQLVMTLVLIFYGQLGMLHLWLMVVHCFERGTRGIAVMGNLAVLVWILGLDVHISLEVTILNFVYLSDLLVDRTALRESFSLLLLVELHLELWLLLVHLYLDMARLEVVGQMLGMFIHLPLHLHSTILTFGGNAPHSLKVGGRS